MELRIREAKGLNYNPDDPYADCSQCDICGGSFIEQGRSFVVISDEDEAESEEYDAIRFICVGCAHLTPFNFRRALELRANEFQYDAHELLGEAEALESQAALAPPEVKAQILTKVERRRTWANVKKVYAGYLYKYASEYGIRTLYSETATDRPTVNSGFIYLLASPDGYCKIGRAKNIHQRLAAISLQLPFKVELIHSIEVPDPVWAERFLHKKFDACRQNGEWFLLTAEEIAWIKSLTTLEP